MNKTACTAFIAGLLLLSTGCAHNALVGDNTVRVGVYFGDYGIKGDGNDVTILSGSRLTKVSFWGRNNTVTVEDGVTLPHVEFWGRNNTITVPECLMIRTTEVGEGNKVILRPVSAKLSVEGERTYKPMGPLPEVTPLPEEKPAAATEAVQPADEEYETYEEAPADMSDESEASESETGQAPPEFDPVK